MRILVLQHTDGEHPARFAELATLADDTLETLCLHRGDTLPETPKAARADVLIAMGGPMDVWQTDIHPWLAKEMDFIARWVRSGRPYLGLCLGHQLLVEALGGRCAPMQEPELGIFNVRKIGKPSSLATLPDQFPALQWHGVEAVKLPESAVPLAEDAAGKAQIIQIARCAWGVQFHPEITPGLITKWMEDDANHRCATAWLGSVEAAEAFEQLAGGHIHDANAQAATLYAALRNAATS